MLVDKSGRTEATVVELNSFTISKSPDASMGTLEDGSLCLSVEYGEPYWDWGYINVDISREVAKAMRDWLDLYLKEETNG